MRVSFIYLVLLLIAAGFCTAHSLSGQPLEKRFTKVAMENESLEAFFTKLKVETGLSFIFPGKVYEYTDINLSRAERTVEEALDIVLKETDLSYRYKDNTVFVYERDGEKTVDDEEAIHTLNEVPTTVQEAFTITGKITDAFTHEPLPGVNVLIKGTTQGTTSDSDGKFVIDARANEVLVFSFIGFKTFATEVAGRTTIDVEMETDVLSLQAVEVIGTTYFSTTKEKSTMNIAKVTAKDIEKQPVTNPLMALQGRMAGVDVTPRNGVAGSAIKIQIRGNNSLRVEGSYPLYIIDGVPIESRPIKSNSQTLLSFGIDPLSTLDPGNIESIEILKDGAATSIYGSRGANGIVRITTKRGSETAKTAFDLNFYSGIGEMPNKLELLNTEQYLAMRHEALANDGISTPHISDYDINGTWDNTRYTDWQEVLLGGRATVTDVHASLSGGNAKTSFRMAGGYHKENTIYPGDFGYTNLTGNLSMDHVSQNQKLRVNLTVNYGANKNNVFDDYSYVNFALMLPPNAPPLYDENGELNWQYTYSIGTRPLPTWTNPLSSLRNIQNVTMGQLVTNGVLSYELFPGLSGKANLGFTDTHSSELLKEPLAAQEPLTNSRAGIAKFGTNSRSTWIIEPQLVYAKNFSSHALDVLIGASWQESRTKYQSITGRGYTSDVLLNSLLGAATRVFNADDEIQYRYNAFFGRIGYNWKSKYLLDISGRRDGSSRFGPGNKFANFAGISGGWIFTKESFMSGLRLISFGKIRSSYAVTGNDLIADYGYLNTYGISPDRYQGLITFYPTALFNPSYAWEETKKLEISLELGFLEDRISMETSWFRNRSTNQLVNASLPSTTGFDFILSNFDAKIENSGWEFLLNASAVTTSKFRWTTSINLTISRNKLVQFNNIEDSPYAYMYQVGAPLNVQRVYTWLGVNPHTGLHKVLDVNQDGFYDNADMKFSKPVGKKYYGGVVNTLTYNNVEFSFLIQFCNQTARRAPMYPGVYGNVPVQVLERWQTEGDVSNYQKFTTTFEGHQANGRAGQSDYVIEDASFVRLKTLSLSYNLSGSPVRKIGMQNARLYVQAQNLLTVTDYLGLDPETGNSMPPLRMITLGIQGKF